MLVDECDIPLLVQKVDFNSQTGLFTVYFFNNKSRMFSRDEVYPELPVGGNPIQAELDMVAYRVTEIAKKQWKQWFLELRIVK